MQPEPYRGSEKISCTTGKKTPYISEVMDVLVNSGRDMSLCYYPPDIKVFWDYGEAHHFKGPHNGIGGTIKRKVYRDVSTNKVVTQDAKHFADYAKEVRDVFVLYLDNYEIQVPSTWS